MAFRLPVIHKVSVSSVGDPFRVPTDAEVLSVQLQYGRITAWYLTSQRGAPYRTLAVFGTGDPCRYGVEQHLATLQDGQFVWHVFDPARNDGARS